MADHSPGSNRLIELWHRLPAGHFKHQTPDYLAWRQAIAELAESNGIEAKLGYTRKTAVRLIDEGLVDAEQILSIFMLTLGRDAQS